MPAQEEIVIILNVYYSILYYRRILYWSFILRYQVIPRIGADTCDTEIKINELNSFTMFHLETFLAALMAILVMRIALTIQANIRLHNNMLECG